jgi:5-hydroxyisourate hydrolase-like protein (transthyretin family)
MDVLNAYDYIVDKLSDLTIKTVDYQNNPVGNLGFTLSGGKILGRYVSNIDVLNTHDDSATDSATGEKKYTAISPGNYDINMNANAQYLFAEHTPTGPIVVLLPDTDLTYEVKVVDVNIDGILVNILDNDTGAPILDAKVSLIDSIGAEVFSDKEVSENGIAYYPDSATPLPAGDYTLKIEAADYVTQEISVTVNKLTQQEVKLVKF